MGQETWLAVAGNGDPAGGTGRHHCSFFTADSGIGGARVLSSTIFLYGLHLGIGHVTGLAEQE